MSRLPHFLDSLLMDGGEVVSLTCRPPFTLLTDGGEVVSLTCQPPFTPQEDTWYSFLLEAESTPGP
jgi:hypothetical protein